MRLLVEVRDLAALHAQVLDDRFGGGFRVEIDRRKRDARFLSGTGRRFDGLREDARVRAEGDGVRRLAEFRLDITLRHRRRIFDKLFFDAVVRVRQDEFDAILIGLVGLDVEVEIAEEVVVDGDCGLHAHSGTIDRVLVNHPVGGAAVVHSAASRHSGAASHSRGRIHAAHHPGAKPRAAHATGVGEGITLQERSFVKLIHLVLKLVPLLDFLFLHRDLFGRVQRNVREVGNFFAEGLRKHRRAIHRHRGEARNGRRHIVEADLIGAHTRPAVILFLHRLDDVDLLPIDGAALSDFAAFELVVDVSRHIAHVVDILSAAEEVAVDRGLLADRNRTGDGNPVPTFGLTGAGHSHASGAASHHSPAGAASHHSAPCGVGVAVSGDFVVHNRADARLRTKVFERQRGYVGTFPLHCPGVNQHFK